MRRFFILIHLIRLIVIVVFVVFFVVLGGPASTFIRSCGSLGE